MLLDSASERQEGLCQRELAGEGPQAYSISRYGQALGRRAPG